MVRAWRLVKNPSQLPQRDWADGRLLWPCGKTAEQLRHVRSQSIRETWTQYDPELVEREYLPKERRKELRTVKAGRPAATATARNRTSGPPEPPRPQVSDTAAAAVTR